MGGWHFLKCGSTGSLNKAKGLENIQNLELNTGFPYTGIGGPNLEKGITRVLITSGTRLRTYMKGKRLF